MHPDMFHVWTTQPLKLSRIQFRLAVELAAQEAAQAELKRQLSTQTGVPEAEINVDGATTDFNIEAYPDIKASGIPVEWID